MGDLPAPAPVHHEDLPPPVRHLPGHRKQLLRVLPVHTGCDHPEVLKEVQEDALRGDDDFPAEHAHQGLERRGPSYHHCLGLCLPELLLQVISILTILVHLLCTIPVAPFLFHHSCSTIPVAPGSNAPLLLHTALTHHCCSKHHNASKLFAIKTDKLLDL